METSLDNSKSELTDSSNKIRSRKWRNIFLHLASVILLITGLAKLYTLTGDTDLLKEVEPIFGLRFSTLMLFVGLTEIGIAVHCFFSKNRFFSLVLVAWISTGFVFYRVGLKMTGWEKPCGCLGNLTDVFRISAKTGDLIATGFLLILLIGSIGLLINAFFAKETITFK